jgi:hypothetical protein
VIIEVSKNLKKSDLSNIDIALFALYKLGGISKKIHTEKIAWEAYQLAKERFSWRLPEFRDKGFPDKTPVRYALESAKKKDQGSLVNGRAGGDIYRAKLEGWNFTPEGATWIKKNEHRILLALKQDAPEIRKIEAINFNKILKSEPCFLYFKQNGNLNEVSSYMLTDLLGCAPDASKEIIKQKFDRLLTIANLTKDKEIIKFLNACDVKFSSLKMKEKEI